MTINGKEEASHTFLPNPLFLLMASLSSWFLLHSPSFAWPRSLTALACFGATPSLRWMVLEPENSNPGSLLTYSRYLTSERLCSYEENSHRALQTFLKDAVSCSGLPGTYYTDSQINSYSPFSSMTLSHRACPHIIASVNPTERSFNQYTELRNNLPRPQGFPAKVRLLPQVAMFMQIRHCSLCVEWTACSQCEPSTRYTVVLSQQQTLSHLSLPPAQFHYEFAHMNA